MWSPVPGRVPSSPLAGARTTAHADKGAASLTPAKRLVAEFAAVGRSIRAVAHSLFVMVKAVGYHRAQRCAAS